MVMPRWSNDFLPMASSILPENGSETLQRRGEDRSSSNARRRAQSGASGPGTGASVPAPQGAGSTRAVYAFASTSTSVTSSRSDVHRSWALASQSPSPGTIEEVIRVHRTVPCEACRRVRRSCEWPDGELSSCLRCKQHKLICSGPARRKKRALSELALVRAAAEQFEQQRQQRTAIGPSSTTAMMTSVQLSYALAYHLVETFLATELEYFVVGGKSAKGTSFACEFKASKGKTSELSGEYQPIAYAYMISGAQLSDHTIIVGTSRDRQARPSGTTTAQNHIEIGLRRRWPIHVFLKKLYATVEATSLANVAFADAVDRFESLYIAIDGYQMIELRPDRYRAASWIIRQGVGLLRDPACVGPARDRVIRSLRGLLFEDVRYCYLTGAASIVSPEIHHQIFDAVDVEQLLRDSDYTSEEVSKHMSGEAAPSEVRAIGSRFAATLVQAWGQVDRLLLFADQTSAAKVVRKVWHVFDVFERYFLRQIHALLDDPRFPVMDPYYKTIRACAAIAMWVCHATEGLAPLGGCHRLIVSTPLPDLLNESLRRLEGALTGIADRFKVLNGLPVSEEVLNSIVASVPYDLNHMRGPILERWARKHPDECESLLLPIRRSARSFPDCAHFVMYLEKVMGQNQRPNPEPAAEIVRDALASLLE